MSETTDLYVMQPPADKPCAQCPFRKASPPGWLGPWQPDDLLLSLGREPFPCHMTIPQEFDPAKHHETMRACAGAAIFLNNKCELSRHPQNAAAQKAVKAVSADVKASVFANSAEFLIHHKRG